MAWVFAAIVNLGLIILCASKNHDTIAGAPDSRRGSPASGPIPPIVKSLVPLSRKAIAYTGLLGIVAAVISLLGTRFYTFRDKFKTAKGSEKKALTRNLLDQNE